MMSTNPSSSTWSPPELWNFPPFFTLQPNESTQARQREAWCQLILSWCSFHHEALLAPLQSWPWWENKALSRRLPAEGVRVIVDALVASGRAEWTDGAARTSLRVKWHTSSEWAALLLAHAVRFGLVGGEPVTVAELANGPLSANTEFAGLETATLLAALEDLARRGHAVLYTGDSGISDEVGVVFKN